MKLKNKRKIITLFSFLLILGVIVFIFPKSPLKEIAPIHFFVIQTGSMMPEIQIGEIVIVKKEKEYQKGDIITYQVNQSYFVTHRIVEKSEKGFYTKGDFNNMVDKAMVKQEEIYGKVILHSNLLGILYQYRRWIIIILSIVLVIR